MLRICACLEFLGVLCIKLGQITNNAALCPHNNNNKKKTLFYVSIILFWANWNTDTVLQKH